MIKSPLKRNFCLFNLKNSRTRRFIRFRFTAPLINFAETKTPKRDSVSFGSAFRQCTENPLPLQLWCERSTRRMSEGWESFSFLEKDWRIQIENPRYRGKDVTAWLLFSRLNVRQTLPAFFPAALQNLTAFGSFRSLQKPVLSFTFSV